MHQDFSTKAGVPPIIQTLARVSADIILPYFRSPIDVENKLATRSSAESKAFDPVTFADKNAETALRKVINQTYPDHGILGEEFGGENLDANYVWVLDPIDGTRAFISGLPLWGTLIALCYKGRPILGAMIQPFLNEIFVGGDDNSWLSAIDDSTKCQALETSSKTNLDECIIFTTEPTLFEQTERAQYDLLEKNCQLHRYGLDCYGYSMVGAGFGDLTVEAGLQIYDIAALVPLIEAAGGVVTDWQGNPVEGLVHDTRLQVLASANAELHKKALDILNAQHRYQG
ncbi:MAG: histidinol-phosphatase [Hyphomicrobiales bacterium]